MLDRDAAAPETKWSVVTPEAVPLELDPAGIGSRFLALAIDWLIQAALAMAVLLGLAPFLDGIGRGVGVALLVVLLSVIVLGYPIALETLWRGRTVGKAALGLRVVTAEGGPIRFRHAVIRASLGLVDFAITSGGAAVLSVLFSSDNRRLGDLAAGTLVLRERTGLRQPVPVRFGVPAGLETYAANLDASGVTEAEYRVVRTFLLRASGLQAVARHHLAHQLAGTVASRVTPPPPPGIDAETFLVAVAATYQSQADSSGPARHVGVASPPSGEELPPGKIPGLEAPVEPPPRGEFAPLA